MDSPFLAPAFAARAANNPLHEADEATRAYWRTQTDFGIDAAMAIVSQGLPADTRVTFIFTKAEKKNENDHVFVQLEAAGRFVNSVKIDFVERAFTDSDTAVKPAARRNGYGSLLFAGNIALGPCIGLERFEFRAARSLGAQTWAKFRPKLDPKAEREVGFEVLRRLAFLRYLDDEGCDLGISQNHLSELEYRAEKMSVREAGCADLAYIASAKENLTGFEDRLFTVAAMDMPISQLDEVATPHLNLGRYLLCFQTYDAYIDLRSARALKHVAAILEKKMARLPVLAAA